MANSTIPVLTFAQDRVFRGFAKLVKENEHPTMMEWGKAVKLSYGSIYQHRITLNDAGLIENYPGRVRSTRITDLGKRYLKRKPLTK